MAWLLTVWDVAPAQVALVERHRLARSKKPTVFWRRFGRKADLVRIIDKLRAEGLHGRGRKVEDERAFKGGPLKPAELPDPERYNRFTNRRARPTPRFRSRQRRA